VMDDLVDGEPHFAKGLAMCGCACGDVCFRWGVRFGLLGRIARRLVSKRRNELGQEEGDAVFHVFRLWVWRWALGDLHLGSLDELLAIGENKGVQRHRLPQACKNRDTGGDALARSRLQATRRDRERTASPA